MAAIMPTSEREFLKGQIAGVGRVAEISKIPKSPLLCLYTGSRSASAEGGRIGRCWPIRKLEHSPMRECIRKPTESSTDEGVQKPECFGVGSLRRRHIVSWQPRCVKIVANTWKDEQAKRLSCRAGDFHPLAGVGGGLPILFSDDDEQWRLQIL